MSRSRRRLPVAAAAGYLLGTLPTAGIVARVARGGRHDLRREGTGNPGAVNAMAVLGTGWGSLILAGDVAKGAAAALAGGRLAGGPGAHLAGSAAVAGHCYPVWSGFRGGGKGVAASCGQCLVTFPAWFPVDLLVAWAVGRWRGRTLPATAVASAVWVAAGTIWWRARWPNGWGPAPSGWLPAAAALSSLAILSRFATDPPR